MESIKETWIVIVHYNGFEWIEKCLESFNKSTYKNQIIVLDNNSPSKEGKELIKTKFPHVILLELNENIGFGRANNKGIEYAVNKGAKYAFLLNQDAWICESNTIEKLVEIAGNYTDYAIVSPVHYNSDKTALDEGFKAYLSKLKDSEWTIDTPSTEWEDLYKLPFINAAAWLINLQNFKKIGLFDNDYFMYGEDFDLTNRTLFHQYKIGFTPYASICHARENRSKTIIPSELSYSEKMQFYGRYLSVTKNINWSIHESYFKFLLEMSVYAIKQMKNGYWNRAWQIILIGLKIIFKVPHIYFSRQRNKKGYLKIPKSS